MITYLLIIIAVLLIIVAYFLVNILGVKEIKERWQAETPIFWKKVKTFWTAILAFSALFVGMEQVDKELLNTLIGPDLLPIVSQVFRYAALISLVGRYQAKLTTTKQPENSQTPGQ